MNTSPMQLKVRLDAAYTTLEHLRKDTDLPLELQLAICTTLWHIEQLRLQLTNALRTG